MLENFMFIIERWIANFIDVKELIYGPLRELWDIRPFKELLEDIGFNIMNDLL